MSNALAIAAVTATLRNLLQNVSQGTGLSGASVTTKPPDRARENETGNQINLFLYQVLPNAAWRNMDIPQRVRSGETAMPPLALNLYYMMTAYGDNNDDVLGHRLLGHAMNILYDHPLLGAQEIQAALPANLNSELQHQIERVRITLQPLSVEEIFRLWSGFQTQYRVSVAYEVAVVLIDSTLPTTTPLPVLTRGQNDRGVASQASLIPPYPMLTDLILPHPPGVLPGDDLTVLGHDLRPGPDPTKPANQQVDNSKTQLRFLHPLWTAPVYVSPKAGTTPTATQIIATIPDDPTNWPAGFYQVAVTLRNSSNQIIQESNELPFSLAPKIETAPPINATRSGGNVTITLKCRPAVRPEQRVALLVGSQEVPFVFSTPTPTQDLSFAAGPIAAGPSFVRLRVDGVDSLLVDRTVSPPRFDPTQQVTIP